MKRRLIIIPLFFALTVTSGALLDAQYQAQLDPVAVASALRVTRDAEKKGKTSETKRDLKTARASIESVAKPPTNANSEQLLRLAADAYLALQRVSVRTDPQDLEAKALIQQVMPTFEQPARFVERLDFRNTMRAANPLTYDSFLGKYPRSKYSAIVSAALAGQQVSQEKQRRVLDGTVTLNLILDLERFLDFGLGNGPTYQDEKVEFRTVADDLKTRLAAKGLTLSVGSPTTDASNSQAATLYIGYRETEVTVHYQAPFSRMRQYVIPGPRAVDFEYLLVHPLAGILSQGSTQLPHKVQEAQWTPGGSTYRAVDTVAQFRSGTVFSELAGVIAGALGR